MKWIHFRSVLQALLADFQKNNICYMIISFYITCRILNLKNENNCTVLFYFLNNFQFSISDAFSKSLNPLYIVITFVKISQHLETLDLKL